MKHCSVHVPYADQVIRNWVFGAAAAATAAKGPPSCALLMGPKFNVPLFPPLTDTGRVLPQHQAGSVEVGVPTHCPITWQAIHPSH